MKKIADAIQEITAWSLAVAVICFQVFMHLWALNDYFIIASSAESFTAYPPAFGTIRPPHPLMRMMLHKNSIATRFR